MPPKRAFDAHWWEEQSERQMFGLLEPEARFWVVHCGTLTRRSFIAEAFLFTNLHELSSTPFATSVAEEGSE